LSVEEKSNSIVCLFVSEKGLNSEARVPPTVGSSTSEVADSSDSHARPGPSSARWGRTASVPARAVTHEQQATARRGDGPGGVLVRAAPTPSPQRSLPVCAGLCRSVPVCAGLCRSVPVCAGLCGSVRWAGFALGDSGELVLASKDACSPSNRPSCFSCFLSRWSLHSTNKVNQQ